MKKRIAIIAALVSLMPVGKTVLIGTGAVITSAGLMHAASEKAYAESAEFYFKRAINKAKEGDFYGAISDYSKAIEINPNDEQAYFNRGNVKNTFLNDNDGAIADCSKAIEINPNNGIAYKNRGIAKELIGDLKGACADWRRASGLGLKKTDLWILTQCY